jgi:hypothetical protein
MKRPAQKSSAKKSPRKPAPSRTNVSRNARRLRREFFARQAEHLFFVENPNEGTPAERERAQRRFEQIEAKVAGKTFLAATLEVKAAAALAELDGDDSEGEE